jgi:uncharacterized protein (DUF885 family)
MNRISTFFVIVALAAGVAPAADAPKTDLESRRKGLNDLLAEQWDYNLSTNPEFASILGDRRWNDKLSDNSLPAIEKDLVKQREFLKRFEAVDTTGFPDQEQLNKTLMVRSLKDGLEGARFKDWEMPVSQISGVYLEAPRLVSYLPFATTKDYDDYITRLNHLPKQFEDTMDNMRAGMKDGLMPPKFLLEKVGPQAEGIAAAEPEHSPFADCLAKFPEGVSAEDQARIRGAVTSAIRDLVNPAYKKFAAFVKNDYSPKGRTDVGIWSLPDGKARYAFRVRTSTTTAKTPEEIHQLGLREVARIEKRLGEIATKLGFKDLKAMNAATAKDPDHHGHSRQEMLDLYTKYIDRMWAKLPELFGRLPKGKVEVKPTESFRESTAAGAEYNQGTPDGSRPGVVNVNTGSFTERTTTNIETTAYHEGVPGHHMQIAIAQELPTLPPFRQQGGNTAYVEGWALYSEDLGLEVGFFQDPYSLYGHYQDEMLRAIRLVVDTGLHYKHWTREQVVQYFHDHSASDEVEVQSETDRYISWPSQALGYKIGQLQILALRESAKKTLGKKFDIRKFHDEVLGAGALPMDVLAERIKIWTNAQLGSTATL